jgi:hypothetical protein
VLVLVDNDDDDDSDDDSDGAKAKAVVVVMLVRADASRRTCSTSMVVVVDRRVIVTLCWMRCICCYHCTDYFTHVNQLILAKQLIGHGANVNAVTIPYSMTPLHQACNPGTVTNLDIVEVLLVEGADPNAQDRSGMTPLMYTCCTAETSPGAAKFLLKWPTTDFNITIAFGASFPVAVERNLKAFSDKVAIPGNPNQVQDQFLLQQWLEIKEMLVERGR